MNTKIRRMIRARLVKSYGNGIAKSMDANNEIRIFHKVKKATIYTAWEDVGNDLVDVMIDYDKQVQEAARRKTHAHGS